MTFPVRVFFGITSFVGAVALGMAAAASFEALRGTSTQASEAHQAIRWLMTPAGPDTKDIRAKVLEDLIDAELARRRAEQ